MSVSTKLKRRNPPHSIDRMEGRRVSSSVSLGRKVLSKAGIKSPQAWRGGRKYQKEVDVRHWRGISHDMDMIENQYLQY